MPRFSYIAIDRKRKTAKGTVTAESPYAARNQLRSKGLHPTTIKEVSNVDEVKTLHKRALTATSIEQVFMGQ